MAKRVLGAERTVERYHCSYGASPGYLDVLQSHGLRFSGIDEAGDARIAELSNHPFFLATWFQPELAGTAPGPTRSSGRWPPPRSSMPSRTPRERPPELMRRRNGNSVQVNISRRCPVRVARRLMFPGMNDQEPTIRSRELGLALARTMDVLGMTQFALAGELDWSPSMVSRMISGKRPVNPELMSGVLGVLRITGPKRRLLMEMARRATELGWWQEYGNRLPPELQTLSAHEDAAIAITNFQTVVIPGLLQTDEYMAALLRATPAIPTGEIDTRTEARRRRRDVFDQKHLAQFVFFIDEYVICRTGAGREVMSGQVHHLLSMTVRPNITIRVIPDAAGFHAGRKSFQLMEFSEINPVVHIENETSVLFLEREDTITGYRNIATELSRIALDEGHSRTWLATVASELGAPREDHREKRPAGIFELEEE